MDAKINRIERRYIVCPGCGKDDGFRIDHLDTADRPQPFGSWQCVDCDTAVRGHASASGVDIEVVAGERPVAALMLLEIGESTPPVYVVLETTIYRPSDPESWDLSYYVDEHTCPTNLIRAEAILWDGDADPHGVLRFVQAVPLPEGYDEDNFDCWEAWAMTFDRMPGQTIEGARVIRALPAA